MSTSVTILLQVPSSNQVFLRQDLSLAWNLSIRLGCLVSEPRDLLSFAFPVLEA